MKYSCIFYPPYTNSPKEVICDTSGHAFALACWFDSIQVKAEVWRTPEAEPKLVSASVKLGRLIPE